VLELLDPRLVLAVGGLALTRLLGAPRRLDDVIGLLLTPDGAAVEAPRPGDARLLLPLPHPSGQSRWLNDPGRLALLRAALTRLPDLVRWAEARESS
jgi:uracil-DNA glycosylase